MCDHDAAANPPQKNKNKNKNKTTTTTTTTTKKRMSRWIRVKFLMDTFFGELTLCSLKCALIYLKVAWLAKSVI